MSLGADVVKVVLEDWRSASISDRLKAMLGFLEKLTLAPQDLGSADVSALAAAGVSAEAARQAVYICFSFSIMDRLADAFGFDVPGEKFFPRIARVAKLLRRNLY